MAVTVTRGRFDRYQGDALILGLDGELDLAGAEVCAVQLRNAVDAFRWPTLVVIDLAGVSFLGVAGIRLLLGFAAEIADRGFSTRFLLPARWKRTMMRVGVAGELSQFQLADATVIDDTRSAMR